AVEGTLRVPLGGSVQPGARPSDGARVPRRNAAGRRRESCALLLDALSETPLDGADAAGARLRPRKRDRRRRGRRRWHGRKVARVPARPRALCGEALTLVSALSQERSE